MKKIYSFLLLSTLLLLGAQNAWALKGGETLYFQVPSAWQDASAKFAAYFYKGETGSFSAFATQFNGRVYSAIVPTEIDGDWTSVIITRTDPSSETPNFGWGQSDDIVLASGNFLYGFDYSGAGSPSWHNLYQYSIKFDNNNVNWDAVSAYTWKDGVTADLPVSASWPGAAMSLNGSLYELTFYAVEGSYIILNNNGAGTQTYDQTLGNYKYVPTTAGDDGKYNVDKFITITPTADGYATFYDPSEKFWTGDGVTAYTGEYNAVSKTLTLKTLLTNPSIIPANTPVVLKASSSAAFDLTLSYATAGTVDGTNNLHGTAAATSTPSNSYVLGYQNSETAFYAFTGATIPANKAYLQINGGAALAGGIRIVEAENNTTAINAVEDEVEAVKFIENGKLLIRKNGIVYDATGCIVR